MIKTTPVKTIELLGKAVEERGEDYTYPEDWKIYLDPDEQSGQCMYVQPDMAGPACIVGHVLYAYGLSLEELETIESRTALAAGLEFGVDSASVNLLMTAQRAQDSGQTWGEAFDLAKQELPLVR